MINNDKLFCKIYNKLKNKHLCFISSNSGTGKTTFFKWLFLRKAVEDNEPLDVFFRWQEDLETKFTKETYLTPPPHASKRLLKLADKLNIIKENDILYIVDTTQDNKKIARGQAVNTQSKVKSNETHLLTCRALFDEVLADDGRYAPQECFKFARLIDTRARYRNYKVYCLYNNTLPFFPYEEYFKNSGAIFYNFTGKKYGLEEYTGIQAILKNSNYFEVYVNNNFIYYKEFYKDFNTKNKETIFYINILNKLFALKDCEDFYILEQKKKIKKNREVLSIDLANNDFEIADNSTTRAIQTMISKRLLFTNNKNNTIYIKELADFVNLCYNE